MLYLVPAAGFMLAACLNVLACYRGRRTLQVRTKILLMPLLALFYLAVTLAAGRASLVSFQPLVLTAILFGWIGDIALLKPENESLFLIGLASFLLGHLFYSAAAVRRLLHTAFDPLIPLLVSVVLIVFCVIYLSHVWSHLGKMKFAVLLYCAVISLMTVSVCTLAFTQPPDGRDVRAAVRMAAIFGTLLFVLSDTILSHTLFVFDSGKKNGMLMSAYTGGQALLVTGLIFLL